MTRRQRRRHLILWILLVPALAFGLALSLSVRSEGAIGPAVINTETQAKLVSR